MRRYFYHSCLRGYAAVTKPFLTSRHVSQRPKWARDQSSWTSEDWGNDLFFFRRAL